MWMLPPIFSSNRMLRVSCCTPMFVPMANSPRRRPPASVSSWLSRNASPLLADASTATPFSKRSFTPSTSKPW